MSLGLLVGRFGNFVRETHVPMADAPPAEAFPEALEHLREATAHHLIPLMLIARADGDFAERERDTIVTHCVTFARSRGLELNGADTLAFRDYVDDYRPRLMQLDPALAKLERGGHDEMAALVEAARAVMEADGIIQPEEKKFLDELSEELGRLGTVS